MSEPRNGHGHVTPNADGSKARCGGPTLCKVCQQELTGHSGPYLLGATPSVEGEGERLTFEQVGYAGHVARQIIEMDLLPAQLAIIQAAIDSKRALSTPAAPREEPRELTPLYGDPPGPGVQEYLKHTHTTWGYEEDCPACLQAIARDRVAELEPSERGIITDWPCKKCGGKRLRKEEMGNGDYEDYRYTCLDPACGHRWIEEGIDS